MRLWLDAQLPPLLAGWINAQGWGIQAVAVRDLGLREASDPAIVQAAREAGVVVMTKDRDFIRLLDEQDHHLRCSGCGWATAATLLCRRFSRPSCCGRWIICVTESPGLRSVRDRQVRPDSLGTITTTRMG
jgi:predicted nuclease of predicted toxin-antitoxin system